MTSWGDAMTSWAEMARDDKALRAFVDAEIARAHVRLHALIVENEHQRMVIDDQKRRIAELEAAVKKGKK
jgi:hypothetical protein